MGTASAQNVAKIGSTEYETLAAAVTAATEGQTITMLSNVDITTGGVTIAEGKNITLDLNGHDIKAGEQNTNNITVNGKLTLEDNSTEHNGKIYTEEPYSRGVAETGVVRVVGGEFVMNSGNIYAVIESNPENYGQFGVVMWEGAKVTINGGQIKAGWYAVANNGTDQSTMAITINGGELISTTDYAIYQPAKNSSLNVTDGVVYGASGAIAANGGTVNVTGGTITSKGQGSTGTWGDGTGGLQNAAINVNAKYGNTTCAISGGTITAEGDAVTLTTNQTYTGTIAVSGGTFSSAIPSEFCAPGFVPEVNEDGTYGVKPDGYVAQIGETKYETLAEAVAAVPADGTETTITMIANETISGNAGVTIPAGKNIVLDLNGKTVKNAVNENKGSQVILNKGTLTIEDNSAEGTGLLTNGIEEGSATGDWWSTPQYNYATNVITNNGTLTITSGKILETATSSICYAIDNNSSAADAILNLEGGLITTLAPTTIRMFCNSTTKENTLNMSEASTAVVESSGTSALWIQLPGSSAQKKKGTINIAGGTLTARDYAFYDYSYGDLYDEVKYNLSGGTYNGSYSFFSYGANIDITGGTYNGEVAIKQVKASEVSVSDGLFAGDVYTYGDNATEKFISGGKFAINTYVYQGTTYACDWLYQIVDGYAAYDNTDPATKDEYPYMVAPAVRLDVADDVVVTTNPEATPEEEAAANAAVEELGSNESVTAADATNIAEMDDVHTLVITVVSASVETEKIAEDVNATISQVTYDVQPYMNDEKVNETEQPLTFRLPVPESFEDVVKVSHKHNGVIVTTTYEEIQGTGANKYVALSSDKFSEWILEYVDPNIELTVYLGNSVPNTMNIYQFVEAQETQPNAMAIVASAHAAEVEGLTNVIVDYPVGHGGHYYECENFVLADIKNWYSPVDFIALTGSYSRGLSAGLTTICVPFSVSENSDFTKYIYHSSNEAGTTAYFNHIDNVDAGVAFLADVHAGTTWICNFNNTRIYANTNVEGGALRGTYQKTTVSDCYKVNQEGTGLQYYSSEITYPFRAYFILTNENVFSGSQTRSLRIAFDELEEGTTGISGVGNDANNNVIYNAQGLRMNKIQNGLNIVNGKKILK